MVALKRCSIVMEHPAIYRLWQSPFARAKFAPILRHNDLARVRRVLDVGCGPGTNAAIFSGLNYTGLDFNARYIEQARQRFAGEFIHADARTYAAPPGFPFDFILVNSLLHLIEQQTVTAAYVQNPCMRPITMEFRQCGQNFMLPRSPPPVLLVQATVV